MVKINNNFKRWYMYQWKRKPLRVGAQTTLEHVWTRLGHVPRSTNGARFVRFWGIWCSGASNDSKVGRPSSRVQAQLDNVLTTAFYLEHTISMLTPVESVNWVGSVNYRHPTSGPHYPAGGKVFRGRVCYQFVFVTPNVRSTLLPTGCVDIIMRNLNTVT